MPNAIKSIQALTLGAALAAILPGCGGSPADRVLVDTSAVRGALLQNPPARLLSLDAAAASTQLKQFGTQLLNIAGAPKCGIDFHHIKYSTVGARGEPTTASGALLVPTGADPACSGKRPVLLYGHGSSFQRKLNMADITDSSNEGGTRISMPAALYAAQGYIVVAPNYAGYDTSSLNYHPHHIADQQSKDMIDALAATRKALPRLPRPIGENGKLFITGYSEGGYVAMATHRNAGGRHQCNGVGASKRQLCGEPEL